MGLREPGNRRLGEEGRRVIPAEESKGPGMAGSGLSTPDTAIHVAEALKRVHVGKLEHGVRLPRPGKLTSRGRLGRRGRLAPVGDTAPVVKLACIGKLAPAARLARNGGPACSSRSARGGMHIELWRVGAGLISGSPGPAAANGSAEKACAQ